MPVIALPLVTVEQLELDNHLVVLTEQETLTVSTSVRECLNRAKNSEEEN